MDNWFEATRALAVDAAKIEKKVVFKLDEVWKNVASTFSSTNISMPESGLQQRGEFVISASSVFGEKDISKNKKFESTVHYCIQYYVNKGNYVIQASVVDMQKTMNNSMNSRDSYAFFQNLMESFETKLSSFKKAAATNYAELEEMVS
jgi:transcription initiation factor IIF auxiliary subunit